MTKVTVSFHVVMRLWWQLYKQGLILTAMLTGLEADEKKVAYWAAKAVYLSRTGRRNWFYELHLDWFKFKWVQYKVRRAALRRWLA